MKNNKADVFCHKDAGKVILRIPDDDFPFQYYHIYAQIDNAGNYYITPQGNVYYKYPHNKVKKAVDNNGYYTVKIYNNWYRIKDLIEQVYEPVPDNPIENYQKI